MEAHSRISSGWPIRSIDQLDAEVEAHQLLEDPKSAELDARFSALESEEGEDEVNDELAALKAKLGG